MKFYIPLFLLFSSAVFAERMDIDGETVRKCASRDFEKSGPKAPKDRKTEKAVFEILEDFAEIPSHYHFNATLPITVPVYWHYIAGDETDPEDVWRVNESIQVMNKAYAKTKLFKFELKEFNYVKNKRFEKVSINRDKQVAEMKKMRKGGRNALNVYSTELNEGLLGWATFPSDLDEEFMLDGVVVARDTMPGGEFDQFNLGMTLVHEAGHWFGLWHTFQDSCSFPNDFVADTRPQDGPSHGCPAYNTITCHAEDFEPSELRTFREMNRLLGPDPVRNYMDYSDDACLSEFTTGQIDRMKAMWYLFRMKP